VTRALLLLAVVVAGCKSAPTTGQASPEVLRSSEQPCDASSQCTVTSIPAVATNCCPTCNVRPIPKDQLVEIAQWCADAKSVEVCEQLDCDSSGSHRIKAACVRGQCVTLAVD
jgi:hypothetical protein